MEKWLQIKGDPSVRAQVFDQTRHTSLFDQRMDQLLDVVEELLCMRGVFHAKLHFSSNQLTCWLFNDPYRYRVFVGEEIFAPNFLDTLPRVVAIEKPEIESDQVRPILEQFRRLRLKDQTIYLRNASINRINGTIGMTFSCDGSHYIPFDEFFETVGHF
ncbi:hypothetical protein HUS23_07670 [Ectothiorhodospiraceae bacterium 2226]|nr:hypothetical protein HUS23_07670 [Ectothiorhodospiraceae bacterium 2226]